MSRLNRQKFNEKNKIKKKEDKKFQAFMNKVNKEAARCKKED